MDYNDRNWIADLIIERPAFDLASVLAGGIWKEVILGCIPCPGLDEGFGIQGMNAFCFYGPAGTGKHTTALAFAGSIPEEMYLEYGYRTFLASGRDLETGDEAGTRRRVRRLFEEAARGSSILILDRLENDLVWEAVADACLWSRNAQNLTVFVIEEDAARIRESFQRSMLLCRFDLPSYEDRLAFFQDMDNRMPRRNSRPSESALAEHTEGMNYIQMKNLVKMVRLHVKAEAVHRFGQDPDRIAQEYQNGNIYYTESEFKQYRGLLDVGEVGQKVPGGSSRVSVFLENPPVISGVAGPAEAGQTAPAEKKDNLPALTDAAIEAELFAELDLLAEGPG